MYTLYDYYRSSASYRVRIVLNYKGLEYTKSEVHLVNNGGEQHSDSYKSINSQELVPTLIDNQSQLVLNQSTAIIEYLQEKHSEPSVLPDDIVLRAKTRAMANIIACDTHPLNNLRVLKYLKTHYKISDDEKMSWYYHWLDLGLSSFENYLDDYHKHVSFNGKFSLGNSLTLADIYLIPQVYNALRFELPMQPYPKIMDIYNHCLSLSYVDDAKP